MVGGGTPVRPTPRTNPSRAGVEQVSIAQKSTPTILPSPAPSDEPSPILANAIVHNSLSRTEKQGEVNDGANSNPTVVSSAQVLENECSAPNQTSNEIETPQTSQLTTLSTIQQSRDPEPLIISPAVLSTWAPTMLPGITADSTAQSTERSPMTQAEQVREVLDGVGYQCAPQRQATTARSEIVSSKHISQRPQDLPQRPIFSQHLPSTRTGQLPSPSQTNASSPRAASDLPLPSTLLQQSQSYPSPSSASSAPSNPPKRQRTQPPVMLSLRPKVALIRQYIKSISGIDNLNSSLEGPRFRLLEDACLSEDSFYIALHQIFCIWDLPDPTQVRSIPEFPHADILLKAFKILGQLIRENEGLAPNHKKWLATFPSPLPDMLRSSEPYRRTVKDVGLFLSKLVAEWGLLSRDCAVRRYPPLVDELVHRMGLLSPTLQRIVFTAARRNLGVVEDHVGQTMEQLFAKDQQDHRVLIARYNTARPPTDREVQERNQVLAKEYTNLISQHMLSRRSSVSNLSNPGPRIPTPVLPSNGHQSPSSPTIVTHGVQPGVNPGSTQVSSPNLPGNWQPANQAEVTRAGSTSSPNTTSVAVAGHSPMLHGQQFQAGTPSPTLLQGLSIQSRAQMQQGSTPVLRSNGSAMQHGPNAVQHSQRAMGPSQVNANGSIFQSPHQNFNSGGPINTPMQNGQYQSPQLQASQYPIPAQIQYLAQQQQLQQQTQREAHQPQWQQQNPVHQRQQQAMLWQQQQQQMQHAVNMNQNIAQPQRGSGSSAGSRQLAHSRNNNMPASITLNVPPARQTMVPGSNTTARPQHPLNRPFLPRSDMVPIPQQINPEATALHHAHLRSPLLIVPDMFPDSQNDKSRRYYQAVKNFALKPTKIALNNPIADFYFAISPGDLDRIPRDISVGPGKLATRQLESGKLQYRLRCIQTRPEVTICLDADWVVSDTVWPESIFQTLDDQHLELRRKMQHGKDLPIDLTRFMVQKGEGRHQVRISSPQWSKKRDYGYFIAVERIETLQHKEVMHNCLQYQRVPANHTLNSIKESLAPKEDDDDDLAMVPGDLTLSLADPFTARIFVTPVRSKTCKHRECFDLETFLLTRNSKPKRPQQPCMVDVWKCPLCGRDARPYSLQVDDFLVSVRAELEKQNNLEAKAILISPDGAWRVKPDPRPEKRKAPYDDDFTDDEEDGSQQHQPREASAKKLVEVIELDDD